MMLAISPNPTDLAAQWEAADRAEEARSVYGRTVDDLRSLLRRAKRVQVAVRVGRDRDVHEITYMSTSPAALRNMLKCKDGGEIVPSVFDPETQRLTVGSLRAISKSFPES